MTRNEEPTEDENYDIGSNAFSIDDFRTESFNIDKADIVSFDATQAAEEHDAFDAPVEYRKFTAGKYGTYGITTNDHRVIQRGPEVEILLEALGFKGDTYTVEVQEEVRQIQEEHNLPASGRVDAATWDIIVNS